MKILADYPISGKPESITIPHGLHTINAYQAVVTVYLSIRGHLTTAFPAFIDPGHNHNFSISEKHLRDWLGIDPTTLPILGSIPFGDERVPLVGVDVLLLRNKKSTNSVNPADPYTFSFSKDKGIMVHKTYDHPLPSLGMRGIMRNDLKLLFDGKGKSFSLST